MKKLILGLVLGMLIGSATVAFAASDLVGTKVTAIFANFNIVINGDAKELETAPLVYNGTSYLPVKEISNLVGYDVTYKADSRTIELNTAASVTNKIEEKDVTKVSATETEKPEKLGDVDKSVWLLLQDAELRFGILYIPKPTGETVIRKNDLNFMLPYDLPKYGEGTYTDGSISIRMKFIGGGKLYNIEGLKTAGFIEN